MVPNTFYVSNNVQLRRSNDKGECREIPKFWKQSSHFYVETKFPIRENSPGNNQPEFFGAVPSSGEDGASHHFMGF